MTQYYWTTLALKKAEQRSLKRVDIEAVLCDKSAQVTKGSKPDAFVYQQRQKDGNLVLRVAVGPLEVPEARVRIRTAYYANASRYWNKDVVTKVCKQHPVYGYMSVLFVFSVLSVLLPGPRRARSRLPNHI